jgi:sterol desaturase/sphingolipid hydroxylase (fatty acid hydroxylase superfamily)
MILYWTFLNTFLASSGLCFAIDMFGPSLRYNGAVLTRSSIIKDYVNMLPLVTTNVIIGYPFFHYVENKWIIDESFTPNNWAWYTNTILWVLMTDFIFYSVHWMLHQRTLYKYIHSVHHQYKYTYGMGAVYAHPVEFYVGNLLPVAAPLVICQMPMETCQWIVKFATFFTVVLSHGGYIVSKSHLNHHLKYRCNYGLAFMDRLLGTQNNQKIEVKVKQEEKTNPQKPIVRVTWL